MTFLMTETRDYSRLSSFFGSSKRASIRKPLLASLKRGLLRRIPKTNLKRILQRMMEAMVKTCTGLRHPSIPSGGVSPIVYVYPWNLAHPRLKISAPLQRSTPATTPNDSKKGVPLVQRVKRQLNLGDGTVESDRKFSAIRQTAKFACGGFFDFMKSWKRHKLKTASKAVSACMQAIPE